MTKLLKCVILTRIISLEVFPMKKIGIFSIQDDFSQALLQRINKMQEKEIKAEFALVGETRLLEKSPYRVIVDRLSYYVDYFSNYFKNAALTGTYVINNPYGVDSNDRFYNYSLAKKYGLHIPRTVCLPTKELHPACPTSDLENLKYPLDWEDIFDFIGSPAILKPYRGFGYRDVYKVNSVHELLEAYNGTGRQTMILQEFINYDFFVKIFVVGAKEMKVIKYDPATRDYVEDENLDGMAEGKKIVKNALKLARKSGYDFLALEFAAKDDKLYAVNFLNPSPNCRPETVSRKNFDWLVDKLAQLAVECAGGDQVNKID